MKDIIHENISNKIFIIGNVPMEAMQVFPEAGDKSADLLKSLDLILMESCGLKGLIYSIQYTVGQPGSQTSHLLQKVIE